MKRLMMITMMSLGLAACGSGGEKTQTPSAPVPERSKDETISFKAESCPTLRGRYKTKDTEGHSNDGFIYAYYLVVSNSPLKVDLGGDFPYVIDGAAHEVGKKEGHTLAYQGWCTSPKTLKVQFFVDGAYIGFQSISETDAAGALRVITKAMLEGQKADSDEIYTRAP